MKSIQVLPRINLLINGTPLAGDMLQSLESIHIRQQLSRPVRCETRFQLQPRQSLNSLTPGATLQVRVQGSDIALFSGQITALAHHYSADQSHHLSVQADDPLHTLKQQQQIQIFTDVSLTDIAMQLISDSDLNHVESHADSPTWPYLIQAEQTHFEFLNTLARRCGLYMAVRDDTLYFFTLEGDGTPVRLTWRENLLSLRSRLSTDTALTGIHATGWHPSRVEPYAAAVTEPRSGRTAQAADVAGSGDVWLLDRAFRSDQELDSLAQAEADYRHAQTLTLYGTTEGNPALRPGAVVDLHNIDTGLTGQHVLTDVHHSLTHDRGFLTEFSTAPPPPPATSQRSLITYGRITRIDDPEHLGRVRASLPAYNDIETDWMTVVLPGAGDNKGLTTLPDTDDRVLVLLMAGDPSYSVVLGGVYGSAGMHDDGIENERVQRYRLQTPGGQIVTLDDSAGVLRLENSDGSFFEMRPNHVQLYSRRNLTLEAPGQAIVIRGNSVDFQRG